jgi:hypothetical protein
MKFLVLKYSIWQPRSQCGFSSDEAIFHRNLGATKKLIQVDKEVDAKELLYKSKGRRRKKN